MRLLGLRSYIYDVTETWRLISSKRNSAHTNTFGSILMNGYPIWILHDNNETNQGQWSSHLRRGRVLSTPSQRTRHDPLFHITQGIMDTKGIINGYLMSTWLVETERINAVHVSIQTVRVRAGAIGGGTHFTWVTQSIDTVHNPTYERYTNDNERKRWAT